MTAMTALRPFSLLDCEHKAHAFPSGRVSVLFFVKEDCPTCRLSAPLIESTYRAFGGHADVWMIGQESAGNTRLAMDFDLTLPILDDSALAISYANDIEIVPTTLVADASGIELFRFVGFAKEDWQELFRELQLRTSLAAPHTDWNPLPATRPGCGSKSVEPELADRLSRQGPPGARRIEIDDGEDPIEFLFEQGFTDGFPVVPPTEERVTRMLAGTGRDPQSVVAVVPPNLARATVEKVAVNAVMAGCRPAYLPVVLAAVEAVCTDEFNMHGVLATTHFPTPVLIVNGPVRDRIGMNYRVNALGQGNRANATIGRAVQLVVRNVGGGKPGGVDRSAIGHPGKYSFCFAEFEERSNWEPLHVERGFQRSDSTVTAFAGGAPNGFVDQLARDACSLATSYGVVLAAASHPKHYFHGEIVVIVPPEHVDTFARDGWTKQQVREQIQLASRRPARELEQGAGGSAEGLAAELVAKIGPATPLSKFRSDEMITLVVAGGEAGKFGAYLGGWLSGPMGSTMVTRKIDDQAT